MFLVRVRSKNDLGNLPPYLLLNSIRSLNIRSPADLTPDEKPLTVSSSGCCDATAHTRTWSGNQLIAVDPIPRSGGDTSPLLIVGARLGEAYILQLRLGI